jgi:hypothetical protein
MLQKRNWLDLRAHCGEQEMSRSRCVLVVGWMAVIYINPEIQMSYTGCGSGGGDGELSFG